MNSIWLKEGEGLGVVPKFPQRVGKVVIDDRTCATCKHSLLNKPSFKPCGRGWCKNGGANRLNGWEAV